MNEATAQRDRTVLGFWLWLMSDTLLFAALFAAYAVLQNNTFGGPDAGSLFSLPLALAETLILLTSSFTMGLAVLAAQRGKKRWLLAALTATLALGAAFLAIEMTDFIALATSGNNWSRSGFLSSFFALVGTHGLHVALGSLWMFVLIIAIAAKGLAPGNMRKLVLLSLFWHFLDLVWVAIFTYVYLMGAI